MRYVSLFPKSPEIRDMMIRLSNMDNKHGIGIRTTPNIAVTLSHHKAIRELSEMDKIDIATKHNGQRRSIIYIPPGVRIVEKGGKFYIYP
jgi:hypothetical protein